MNVTEHCNINRWSCIELLAKHSPIITFVNSCRKSTTNQNYCLCNAIKWTTTMAKSLYWWSDPRVEARKNPLQSLLRKTDHTVPLIRFFTEIADSVNWNVCAQYFRFEFETYRFTAISDIEIICGHAKLPTKSSTDASVGINWLLNIENDNRKIERTLSRKMSSDSNICCCPFLISLQNLF